jgi:ABC-2 type transport system ATP-binding protein
MIEVTNLSKSYGKNRGINSISFSIPEGQIVGFLGPNGAGKTTTMNIITGYLSADSGKVTVAGIDMLRYPFEAKKKIGYLPELPPLYHSMTVKSYLDFVYELKNVKTDSRKKHIGGICEMTGLTDVYSRVVGHLSKGYKQRIGLAQALIGDPDVLVLDEPTIGLDPRQIVEIRNLIKKMGKKRTIILSTHILPEVSAVCERVLLISNGAIVADDNPDGLAILAAGDKAVLRVRIASAKQSLRALLAGINGVRNVKPIGEMEKDSNDFLIECAKGEDIRRALFNELAKADCPILMLRPHDATLEDIFLKLTEDESEVE